MDGGAFISLLVSQYNTVLGGASITGRSSRNGSDPGTGETGSLISRFKTWFVMAIRNADIRENGIGILPEEVLIRKVKCVTSERQEDTTIIDVLSLFSADEIQGLFGSVRGRAMTRLMMTFTSLGGDGRISNDNAPCSNEANTVDPA